MILESFLTVLVFAFSYLGIRFFIDWSRERRILDVPNERSSHSRPVPVGAGLVISSAVLILFAVFLFDLRQGMAASNAWLFGAYFAASILLIVVSWLDDVRDVPVAARFAVHAAAAAAMIYAAPAWLESFGEYKGLGAVLTFLWITGLTNAYNFMDGIDGIAGVQAVTGGIGWALLGYLSGAEAVGFAGLAVAAASGAFLLFNWQPARVFMGDSGSAFMGFSFAVFPLIAATESKGGIAGTPWMTGLYSIGLLWPFVFDSCLTFFRRLVRGERVWKPHRRHLYQAMVIRGMEHARVSIIYGACGAFCTAAVAAAFIFGYGPLPLSAALALVSLVLVIVAAAGGRPVRPDSGFETD